MGVIALTGLMAGVLMASPSEAEACGGCFHTESQSTQVVGHRMVLSLSQTQTTLWDQFDYAGDPADFAWVLPIKGQVDIGVSSEPVLAALEQSSSVVVYSPPVPCDPCAGSGGGGGVDSNAQGDPVEIIAQEVVGPFETVQLSSADGSALFDWLQGHGYEVPSEIQPIIDAYVAESFDFLALKLVPGTGVAAMRPVRVTTPGASPSLPLRMVAAGTGAFTALKLIVLSEGRYQPANAPSVLIDRSQLVWDWDSESSNYALLRDQAWQTANNTAWLTESSYALNPTALSDWMVDWATSDPEGSGYGGGDPSLAVQEAAEDAAAMFGHLDPSAARATFLSAKLSHAALAEDLLLEASPDQSFLAAEVEAAATQGDSPPCPECPDGNGSSGHGGNGGSIGIGSGAAAATPGDPPPGGGCGCEWGSADESANLALLALLFGLATSRRRARRSSP